MNVTPSFVTQGQPAQGSMFPTPGAPQSSKAAGGDVVPAFGTLLADDSTQVDATVAQSNVGSDVSAAASDQQTAPVTIADENTHGTGRLVAVSVQAMQQGLSPGAAAAPQGESVTTARMQQAAPAVRHDAQPASAMAVPVQGTGDAIGTDSADRTERLPLSADGGSGEASLVPDGSEHPALETEQAGASALPDGFVKGSKDARGAADYLQLVAALSHQKMSVPAQRDGEMAEAQSVAGQSQSPEATVSSQGAGGAAAQVEGTDALPPSTKAGTAVALQLAGLPTAEPMNEIPGRTTPGDKGSALEPGDAADSSEGSHAAAVPSGAHKGRTHTHVEADASTTPVMTMQSVPVVTSSVAPSPEVAVPTVRSQAMTQQALAPLGLVPDGIDRSNGAGENVASPLHKLHIFAGETVPLASAGPSRQVSPEITAPIADAMPQELQVTSADATEGMSTTIEPSLSEDHATALNANVDGAAADGSQRMQPATNGPVAISRTPAQRGRAAAHEVVQAQAKPATKTKVEQPRSAGTDAQGRADMPTDNASGTRTTLTSSHAAVSPGTAATVTAATHTVGLPGAVALSTVAGHVANTAPVDMAAATATASLPTLSPVEPRANGIEFGLQDTALGDLRIQAAMSHGGQLSVNIASNSAQSQAELSTIAPLLHASVMQHVQAQTSVTGLQVSMTDTFQAGTPDAKQHSPSSFMANENGGQAQSGAPESGSRQQRQAGALYASRLSAPALATAPGVLTTTSPPSTLRSGTLSVRI